MTATFAHASPSTAFGPAPADRVRRASYAQWVDTLVTFAAMAWFSAALVGMAGELHAFPSTAVTQSAATRELATALPQASSKDGGSPLAAMRLI